MFILPEYRLFMHTSAQSSAAIERDRLLGGLASSLYWLVLAVLVIACPVNARIAFAQTPIVGEIAKSWRKRQESIKSARMSWAKELFLGSDHAMSEIDSAGSADEGVDVVLSISGSMFRLEAPILSLNGSLSRMVHVFDGKLNRMLVVNDDGPSYSGAIGEENYFYDLKNVHLRPALMYLRPLHPRLITLRPDTFTISERRERIKGRECVVMAQTASNVQGPTEVYWLDPTREFLPVQWQERYNGAASAMVQIEYGRNSDGLVIPTSWKCSLYALSGDLREGSRASNIQVALNEPIAPADFSIGFPEGTVLGDRRQNGEQFVVAGDGRLRPLGATEPLVLPVGSWTIPLLLLGATIIVVILAWRWRRSRAHSEL
jgi:hypothetical protein